ncbi:UDP-glucose 4-epimerase GalE [Myceligenerans halotolerans]
MGPVLLTGAAGLLGVPLIRRLRRLGADVVAVDDGSAGTLGRLNEFATDPGVHIHPIDIRDPAALKSAAAGGVGTVVHLAARHFIPACEKDPATAWDVNVRGTANVLETAHAVGCERLVLASTADVYVPRDHPHDEDAPTGTATVYGRTKIAAERLVAEAAVEHPEHAYLVLRFFNLYGAHPTAEHLIPTVMRQALDGRRLELGDLSSVRDYVHVEDAADAVLHLLRAEATGIMNIGTGVGASGRDIVRLVGEFLGRELEVVLDPARVRTTDRPHLVADPGRLVAALGSALPTTLREGLDLVIDAAHARLASTMEAS